MSQSLESALELIAERAQNDPELAVALRTLLEGVLAQLPDPAPRLEPEPEPIWDEPEATEEPTGNQPDYAEWPDLDKVAINLGLKSRAARWVAEHGYTEERAALSERYALMDDARASGSFLWMFDRNRVDPYATAALREVAELYALTARALAFWQTAGDTPDERDADKVMAETQAALRTAAFTTGGWYDPDQFALFTALRLSAQASRTFLPQLSRDYQPLGVNVLTARLDELEEARAQGEAQARSVGQTRNKLCYHVSLVVKDPGDRAQWFKVDEATRELHALNDDAQELLASLQGFVVPETLPELAASLAVEAAPSPKAEPNLTDTPSESINRARDLLRGREVVIIGGDERKEAVTQLSNAFDCRVRWLETAPHTSLSVLEPAITDDVAVVLLLIRWSSHVYGELVHICKARGVPLDRLVGGYNPNRVAHDVLEQAGERLEHFLSHTDPTINTASLTLKRPRPAGRAVGVAKEALWP